MIWSRSRCISGTPGGFRAWMMKGKAKSPSANRARDVLEVAADGIAGRRVGRVPCLGDDEPTVGCEQEVVRSAVVREAHRMIAARVDLRVMPGMRIDLLHRAAVGRGGGEHCEQ